MLRHNKFRQLQKHLMMYNVFLSTEEQLTWITIVISYYPMDILIVMVVVHVK